MPNCINENRDEAIKLIEQRNKDRNMDGNNKNNFDIKFNNDNIFKAERMKPTIFIVRKYYILLGIIFVRQKQ